MNKKWNRGLAVAAAGASLFALGGCTNLFSWMIGGEMTEETIAARLTALSQSANVLDPLDYWYVRTDATDGVWDSGSGLAMDGTHYVEAYSIGAENCFLNVEGEEDKVQYFYDGNFREYSYTAAEGVEEERDFSEFSFDAEVQETIGFVRESCLSVAVGDSSWYGYSLLGEEVLYLSVAIDAEIGGRVYTALEAEIDYADDALETVIFYFYGEDTSLLVQLPGDDLSWWEEDLPDTAEDEAALFEIYREYGFYIAGNNPGGNSGETFA